MKIHNLIQGDDEWAAFRLTHYGASEAAAMLGLSPNKTTRAELLRMKYTGTPKQFSEWVQKNILDKGHEVEAMARPIIEEMIGEDLYPVTCSNEDTGGRLCASCDGLTMDYGTAFEHKQWNAGLAGSVAAGALPGEYMPQCQQIMLVTGARRVIFVVSDGTPENCVHLEVRPDPAWFARIKAGWEQFARDLAEYQLPTVQSEPVGHAPAALPALRIDITGMVTASNLPEFRDRAIEVFRGIRTDLQTTQDFEDAEATVKWCGEIERRLDAAKEHALGQTASIDELFRSIDAIKAEARAKRLELDKLVKDRKQRRREELVMAAKGQYDQHVSALVREFARYSVVLDRVMPDFASVIKGMSNFEKMQDELDGALANAKIEINARADDLREKMRWFDGHAAAHRALFRDLQSLCAKPPDDFQRAVQQRIDEHQRAEQARLDAERERIRREEQAKAEAAAQAERERIAAEERAKAEAAVRAAEQVANAGNAARQDAPAATATDTATAGTARAAATGAARDADVRPMLNLTAINDRLAPIALSAAGLGSLGFPPAATEKASKLWFERDFPRICAALVQHVQRLSRSECRVPEAAAA